MKKKLNSEKNDTNISNNNDKSQNQKWNKENNDNITSSNQNTAPFNISEERFLSSETEKNNPGPGSYFKNILLNKIFNHKKNETIKENAKNYFKIFN